GVVESFSGEAFYLSTTCPTTLLHLARNEVDYEIITIRGKSGLIERVELTLNKIKTVVENGKIFVEDKRMDEFGNYVLLCEENIEVYENKTILECAFYSAIGRKCFEEEFIRGWEASGCSDPVCPGDLKYEGQGSPYIPTCSNPEVPKQEETIQTCVCPQGTVLNNYENGSHCVAKKDCPCVHIGKLYAPGAERSTKCQSCICENGAWTCSIKNCPDRCVIEGGSVTTFDGKRYTLPKACTYVASQDVYTFSRNSVKVGNEEINELHQTGLCGNYNDDTTDDFTTSYNIRENSARLFALSWATGMCADETPEPCGTDLEKVAHQDCSRLTQAGGIFAKCHDHVPSDHYYEARPNSASCLQLTDMFNDAHACVRIVCNCQGKKECLCVALSNYAKACACQGITVGDWRKDMEDCMEPCDNGLQFGYDMRSCNSTCLSLTGSDPSCQVEDAPVEGCGCTAGTYLNSDNTCSTDKSCESGCYCPEGQYEDDYGFCVSPENCTCLYSGVVYTPGQTVTASSHDCTCKGGEWECVDNPCPGRKCEVYGNGHYQTFDSKWYHFDGYCRYILVQDNCGSGSGTFSVTAESVPCCDEKLTCSRRIILTLQGNVTLKLDDLEVMEYDNDMAPQYTVHTIGLHTVISVPSLDVSLIWDKHTRLSIILGERWKNKVCGLCGNYNNNEKDDLQIQGSMEKAGVLPAANSWKMPTPSCSDVVEEQFPCERFSYCSHWAERRCMILSSDIFKDCHTKVDYTPYFRACLKETCACNRGGPFQGFCIAVAAYAEACCEEGVSVKWRTPERCPVYCDYYNKQNQDSSDPTWHYEPCGNPEIKTCGENKYCARKLEGGFCWDAKNLVRRAIGYTWTEGCTKYRCMSPGIITETKVTCPALVKPDCPNGKMRKVKIDECCRCELYGDPHYISFDGTSFSFQGSCNYILVDEIMPTHNFSVIVDNYNCASEVSCVRGVQVKYGENTVTLSISPTGRSIVITFNKQIVPQPYEDQGIQIRSNGRSVCGGAACVRRDGTEELNDCCDKTAYDWVYPDPLKPSCANKQKPCTPTPPPPTVTPTPCPPSHLCDLLTH
ncbi:hypothetical protein JZ751_003559, partial [Albula glossodonta]